MSMFKYLFFIFFIALIFSQNSCTYNKNIIEPIDTNKNPICDTCPITYNLQIKYLILRRCAKGDNGDASCHFGDNSSRVFDSYQGLTGSMYYKNKLLSAVEHASGTIPMPYNNPKISISEIDSIRKWVNKGFPEN